MAHRQEEAENHWPGFVDALSTIVMVVTFLLIILGVVIFVIAQQIKASVGTSDEKSEETKQYFEPPTPDMVLEKTEASKAKIASALAAEATAKAEQAKADEQTKQAELKIEQLKAQSSQNQTKNMQVELKAEQIKLETAKAAAAKANAEATIAQAEAVKAEAEAEKAKAEQVSETAKLENQKIKIELQEKLDGKAKLVISEQLTQDRKTEKEINGQKVISQAVDDSKKITIASDETAKEFKANIVQSANAILTLIFDSKSVTIDANSADEINKFLTEKNIIKQNGKIEIRSFVNLNQASMGERRRLAFYRAMAARNELLKLEVAPDNISIRVKEVDDEKLAGILKIYIKP